MAIMADSAEDHLEPSDAPINKTSTPTKPVGQIATDVYAAAAECLDAVLKQRASVNSAIFHSPFADKRFLLAITQKTIDNLQHLKRIVFNSQVLVKEPRLTKSMAYVVAFDMLFGEMRQPRGIAKLMTKFTDDLNKALGKYLKDQNVTHVSELRTETPRSKICPRYARVNTLKTTMDEVVKALTAEHFSLVEYDSEAISQHSYLKMLRSFKPTQFFHDYHVPDLLVFHPSINFHGHALETSGKLVLQDKASCLPSLLLNPPTGSTVIDACAAPGMKTSHLAAVMKNHGKIYAVDIKEDRSKTMETLLKHYDATCAEVVNMDFTKVSPEDDNYADVTHILVDPTCTGSGVTNKFQNPKKKSSRRQSEDDKKRLQKLKGLQVTLLKHALSFPKVERIVYSTCSINPEEDEEVVQEALKSFAASFVVRPFSKYLPKWKGCGKPRYSVGPSCLRSFPEKHRTNGFFVAVIERFTAADAEAAQTGTVEAEEEEVVSPVIKTESAGKKGRKRKNRHHDAPNEHWSAANGIDSDDKSPKRLANGGTAESHGKKIRKRKKKCTAEHWSAENGSEKK